MLAAPPVEPAAPVSSQVSAPTASTSPQAQDQWSAKRFMAESSEQQPQAPVVSQAGPDAIVQEPRQAATRSQSAAQGSEARAQPFQRSGVVRLQAGSKTQSNKKFMKPLEPATEEGLAPKKKRRWGLSLLGLFLVCGLGTGGLLVMKAYQIDDDGSSSEQPLVTTHQE